MKGHILKVIFLFFIGIQVSAQTIDKKALYEEVTGYNNAYQYEKSIERLEEILFERKSTNLDLFHAYLLKSYTHKRVFNYPAVLENLGAALEAVRGEKDFIHYETKIMIEKMLISFDLMKYGEVDDYLKDINKRDLSHLDASTLGFYYNVLASLEMDKMNYKKSREYLHQVIEIFKKGEPRHLPMAYSKMINLSAVIKDVELGEMAFDSGMYYAEKWAVDIYKVRLLQDMNDFYFRMGDFENAYYFQKEGNELFGTYGAPYQSGKLSILETELLKNRKDLELRNKRNVLIFALILLGLLSVLILVLFRFFKLSRSKRKLVEQENDRIRAELEYFTQQFQEKESALVDKYGENLSERQLEIIDLVKKGKTNREIGEELFISENTVKYHLKNIYTILGIESRNALK